MAHRIEQHLEDYCVAMDAGQVPLGVDEVLARTGVVRVVPELGQPPMRVRRWRASMFAGFVGVAAVTIFVTLVRPAGVGTSPSPLDVPTTTTIHSALLRPLGDLEPGYYIMAINGSVSEYGIGLTLPEGWVGARWNISKPGSDPVMGISAWEVGAVYGHPCQWRGTLFDPGPTTDDLAGALTKIPMRNASAPQDVSIGEYHGSFLSWTVPEAIDFTNCDMVSASETYDPRSQGHYFESWVSPTGGDRFQELPGQVDRLWIIDVAGTRVVVDAWHVPGISESDLAELQTVIDTIVITR